LKSWTRGPSNGWKSRVPLSYRALKMKLNKDKTELTVNSSLKLTGFRSGHPVE
jgi:hypothetical protein